MLADSITYSTTDRTVDVLIALVILALGVLAIVYCMARPGNPIPSAAQAVQDAPPRPRRPVGLTLAEVVANAQLHDAPAGERVEVLRRPDAFQDDDPDEVVEDGQEGDEQPPAAPAVARVPVLAPFVIQGEPTEPATLYTALGGVPEADSAAWRWDAATGAFRIVQPIGASS
jgi:hypothetical protein